MKRREKRTCIAIKITSLYSVARWRRHGGGTQSSIPRLHAGIYKVSPAPTGAVSTKRHLWQRNSALGLLQAATCTSCCTLSSFTREIISRKKTNSGNKDPLCSYSVNIFPHICNCNIDNTVSIGTAGESISWWINRRYKLAYKHTCNINIIRDNCVIKVRSIEMDPISPRCDNNLLCKFVNGSRILWCESWFSPPCPVLVYSSYVNSCTYNLNSMQQVSQVVAPTGLLIFVF